MRGVFRFLFYLAVVLALSFYGGGGWYFSNELIADAFAVTADEEEARHSRVVAVDDSSVTVEPGTGDDSEAGRPGVFGLDWDGGYGRVGEITDSSGEVVTRRVLDAFDGLEGLPGLGVAVDIDSYAYPAELPPGWEVRAVDTPLGPMEAWFASGSRGTWVIHIHGRGAERNETLRAAVPLAEAGYPQLVMSYRNDPDTTPDPSGYYRYGISEWSDLEAAVELATGAGADNVVLYGYSTGGAVAMAYLERAVDPPVIGAVFDSPNLDFAATVDFNASQRTLPGLGVPVPGSLAWVARTITSFRIDVDWDAIDYIDRADRLEVPVLVFHGTDDSTVPIETSRRFAAESEHVELIEVEGAEHVQSWNRGPDDYEGTIVKTVATMESDADS